jgi:dimethylaniline monooxygenase (N-oxide forming)
MTENRAHSMPERSVAVLGAGPAGLACARWLERCGFEPVVFEAAERLGGQWNRSSPLSGTWSGMRTNTSRVLSAFSDFPHPEGTAAYPQQADMLAYLERYAEQFDIARAIRFQTEVERLDRCDDAWLIRSRHRGARREELFRRVVVASGRHICARIPPIPGIETFSGSLGVVHARQYGGAHRYRDKDVVVLGCSVSALEISADLALGGARKVTAAYRRPRYVLPKIIAGVPNDHVLFTRAAALAAEGAAPEAIAAGMKAFVSRVAGNPARYGATAPDENVLVAGISQSQHFLSAVAEGRIVTRPAIDHLEGRTVYFTDGTTHEADAVVLGTGYRISLPWLAPSIAAALAIDDDHIDLHDFTFHPDLPGLAFLGVYEQIGPLLPVLELQARWIAYTFAGLRPAPTPEEMQQGLARARERRKGPKTVLMHSMALLFARRAGVEPDPERWPELRRALLSGPLSPVSFRLEGPDSLADAPARTAAEAAAFGYLDSN